MEKLAITVKIPALGNSYDFIVPDNMSINDAKQLILQILNSEYGISEQNTDVMLFDTKDCKALHPKSSFSQLGILDGAKLIMM